MVLDIITAFDFLKELSTIPSEYKIKLKELSSCVHDSKLDNKYLSEITEYFRQENWKFAWDSATNENKGGNDKDKFAGMILMLLVALDTAYHQNKTRTL